MEQTRIVFSENTRKQIIHYHQAGLDESKTEGSLVKLSPSQKVALKSICNEHHLSESSFLRDAAEAYIEMFPFKEKIRRHKDYIIETLNRLS